MSGEVIRDTQVGTEGDDVPDHLNEGRQPQEYEGAGTHRFETRMSDEEISKGISRDARRAAELMKKQMEHDKTAAPMGQQASEQAQQQAPVRGAGADVTDQPSS